MESFDGTRVRYLWFTVLAVRRCARVGEKASEAKGSDAFVGAGVKDDTDGGISLLLLCIGDWLFADVRKLDNGGGGVEIGFVDGAEAIVECSNGEGCVDRRTAGDGNEEGTDEVPVGLCTTIVGGARPMPSFAALPALSNDCVGPGCSVRIESGATATAIAVGSDGSDAPGVGACVCARNNTSRAMCSISSVFGIVQGCVGMAPALEPSEYDTGKFRLCVCLCITRPFFISGFECSCQSNSVGGFTSLFPLAFEQGSLSWVLLEVPCEKNNGNSILQDNNLFLYY